MATTNFIEWNPTQANQLSDSAYAADTSRSGGAGTGAVFPSATANKLFRQPSMFVAAFGAMFATKGFSTSDANVNALATVLANLITSADINAPLVTVSYSASLTFDFSNVNGFYLPLTGNVASTAFNGVAVGQQILCAIQQDSTGGRTFAWPSNVLSPGTVDPTPNATSVQVFVGLPDGNLHPLGAMTVS